MNFGDGLDEELDFYRDDDDVAVLFYQEDGTKIWCLGNIEEVAVARGTVDERRAIASTSATYLLGLDKEHYKPKGVFVDDPKGLFILRWYKEVDKDGKELSGFQNPKCAGYKLTSNNCGEPFRWTGNVQLISKQGVPQEAHQPNADLHPEQEGRQDGPGLCCQEASDVSLCERVRQSSDRCPTGV